MTLKEQKKYWKYNVNKTITILIKLFYVSSSPFYAADLGLSEKFICWD